MSIKKEMCIRDRLRLYIPEDVQAKLGLGKLFERKYKTRREAKEVELKLSIDIKNAKSGKSHINIKNKGEIIFKKFYEDIWLEPYKAGQTTTTIKPPTKATVFQTENIFRLHILPILGKYSIEYPNNNKQLILSLLTPKANSYANFQSN
mgnify:FL=1